jgi:hypothetical protein
MLTSRKHGATRLSAEWLNWIPVLLKQCLGKHFEPSFFVAQNESPHNCPFRSRSGDPSGVSLVRATQWSGSACVRSGIKPCTQVGESVAAHMAALCWRYKTHRLSAVSFRPDLSVGRRSDRNSRVGAPSSSTILLARPLIDVYFFIVRLRWRRVSQMSVLMKPVPQEFHSAGSPSVLICSSVLPAAIFCRTMAVVSTNMR